MGNDGETFVILVETFLSCYGNINSICESECNINKNQRPSTILNSRKVIIIYSAILV